MSDEPVWASMPRPDGISERFWTDVSKAAVEGDAAASRIMWKHYALYMREAMREVVEQLGAEHSSPFVRTAQQIAQRTLRGEVY